MGSRRITARDAMQAYRMSRLREDMESDALGAVEEIADFDGDEGLLGKRLGVVGRPDHTARDQDEDSNHGTLDGKAAAGRSKRKGIEQIAEDITVDRETHAGKHLIPFKRPAMLLVGEKTPGLNDLAALRKTRVRRNRQRVTAGSTTVHTMLSNNKGSTPVMPKDDATDALPKRHQPIPLVTGYAIAS